MSEELKTILTVLCSGAFLTFLQFLITRSDNKKDKIKVLEAKIIDVLDTCEKTSKTRYDEHETAISELHIQQQQDYQALKKAINELSGCVKKLVTTQDVISAINVGIVHNMIIEFTNPIIERDGVTYEELATLDSLYVPYSKLGGNGECKRRYEDVNKLTKITKERAIKKDKELEAKRYKALQEAR